MPYKPIKLRAYQRWISGYGWSLVKAGIDWKLLDTAGNVQVQCIIVTHPGKEVIPLCIKKTKIALNKAGLE